MKIGVILTVHNRWRLTDRCLKSLIGSIELCDNLSDYHVYIVDDGSKDKTALMLSKYDSELVTVVKGSGNLYWAGGMVKGMNVALGDKNITHFALINNDVVFNTEAFTTVLQDYFGRNDCIIVGAFQNESNNKLSYGLRDRRLNFVPLGKKGVYPNGNFIFVSRASILLCGGLSKCYQHGYADFEFGIRLLRHNRLLYASSDYLGRCEGRKNKIAAWKDAKNSLNKRLTDFRSPTGFGISDYKVFLRDSGNCYYLNLLNVYLKVIFPKLWK
ncbi:glycosyltransferase [Akkermansiaceae bacterium]|nr:glycosyltransferase [Akkermansiaceae bacterium]